MSKKTLSLDFDGVCHSYTSPWVDAVTIPDCPVAGLYQFLEAASREFIIEIYSTRSETEEGREAMTKWFYHHSEERYFKVVDELRFPSSKPKAFVGLDDRIITFAGIWPAISSLTSFKPWNKGESVGLVISVGIEATRISLTRDELEDLRTLLFTEKRAGMLTGGSSIASEAKRRRDSFERIYNLLPPGRTPDAGGN